MYFVIYKMDNYVIIKNDVPKELQFMGNYQEICMIESKTVRGIIAHEIYFDYISEYAYILPYYSIWNVTSKYYWMFKWSMHKEIKKNMAHPRMLTVVMNKE